MTTTGEPVVSAAAAAGSPDGKHGPGPKHPAGAKGAPVPMPPPVSFGSIPWRSVFRWAFYVVGAAPVWVAIQTGMSVLVNLVAQYNMQVLATATSALSAAAAGPCTGANCPAAAAHGGGGLIAALLPHDGATAAILFAVLTVVFIALVYLDRIIAVWTDNVMIGRLRQDVHDKVLTLGPTFHENFAGGRATMLVTAFVQVAQLILKEVVTAPITRLIPMLSALAFLAYNLRTIQQQDVTIQVILLAGLVVLPVIGWFLSARLQAAFTRARDSQTALTEEFLNSVHRPFEVQLMGAGPQRAAAFARRVQAQIHDQIAAAMRQQLATQFQNAMPRVLQAAVLIYGIFVALKSGNPEAAGAILGLYFFVPQVIAPIQDLLQFVAGFTASWPQVSAVIEVLEAKPDSADQEGRIELSPNDSTVEFRNVTFAYAPDRPKFSTT